MTQEGFVIDTPQGIQAYRYIATLRGLDIEIRTQETFGTPNNFMTRGMSLASAKRILKENGRPVPRTRKKARAAMQVLCEELELVESS